MNLNGYDSVPSEIFNQLLDMTLIIVLSGVILVLFLSLGILNSRRKSERGKFFLLLEKKNKTILSLEEKATINNADFKALIEIISQEIKPALVDYSVFFRLANSTKQAMDEEELQKIVQKAKHSSKQAYRFMLNLIDWVDLKANRVQSEIQSCSVLSILEREIETFSGQLFIKRLKLQIQVLPEFRIMSDPQFLSAIFRNLISNAIKFTPEEGSIDIIAHFDGKNPVIDFIDSGIGISEPEIKPMFNNWILTSRPGTNNEKGIGLGFVIAREYLKLLDGNLIIESEKGIGTQIRIEFS